MGAVAKARLRRIQAKLGKNFYSRTERNFDMKPVASDDRSYFVSKTKKFYLLKGRVHRIESISHSTL